MEKQVKLGLLQISSGPDMGENLKKLSRAIGKLEKHPDIVITPEYFTGLKDGKPTVEMVKKNAIDLDSDLVDKMKEKAKEIDSALLFTVYLEEKGFYNASIFLNSSGEIEGVYRKTHLFDAFGHIESELFSPGEKVEVFDWRDYRMGLATCFDLRFPELFRIMSHKGADLVLVPSGFYSGEHKAEQWRTLIQSRAHENNFFVIGVNQPEPHFVGESMAASPLGYGVERLGGREEVRTIEIGLEEVNESKETLPINRLSRPDFYRSYEPYR